MSAAVRPPVRPVADPAAVLRGDHWRISVLTDGLVRLEYDPSGRLEDRPTTFAQHRELPVPAYRVVEGETHVEVVTDRLHLTYDRGPFTAHGLVVAVRGGVSSYHSVWRFGQPVDDLGGTARTLDGADGAVPLDPGVVSRDGYAVIDDRDSFVLDEQGWAAPRVGPDGADDERRQDLYVFAYGHDHHEALRALYAVSGPTPVLPRWALGTWWSRFHRYTTQSYQALVTRFEQERIPLSVSVIDMDWHLTEVDPVHGSGWTGYTWNRDLFPDPPAFLAWLHEHGLRVTLNVHPADGVRAFEEAYPAMAAALGQDPGDGFPIAFDVTDPDFMRAYLDVLHRGLEDDGVDFWWIDWQQGGHSRTPGVDPLWVLNREHYLDNARDGRRGLTFSRYAGPGSHRHPVGFSGDTVISWASLAFQPLFTATASNIGYGWWSHDIGGHFCGSKDDELTARWVQLGTFSPILRLHSGANEFTTKEPWGFDPEARAAMTDFLRLRHRLVPYLHSMNHRAAEGLPLVLPLYYDWPEVDAAYAVPHEFLFGTELLVAPITQPADPVTRLGQVQAWLPPGRWVDVLTDLVYDGGPASEAGRVLHLHRDLTSIPVLARAGAIVPLDGGEELPNDPVEPRHVELLVVVGGDGETALVEDDGAADGVVARTGLRWDQGAGRLEVVPPGDGADFLPPLRTWTVTFPALDTGVAPTVRVAGERVEAVVRRADTRVSVTVVDVPLGSALQVDLGPDPQVAPPDVRTRLFALLDRARMAYETKSQVLAAATSDRSAARRASDVQALDLDRALTLAVLEVLLAPAD